MGGNCRLYVVTLAKRATNMGGTIDHARIFRRQNTLSYPKKRHQLLGTGVLSNGTT
jgi:hypothetical protein